MRNIQIRSAKKVKERKTIGFLGVEAGVGTTHIAIAAANYAANEWGMSTAVAELGRHLCISSMDEDEAGSDCFVRERVCYYPQVLSMHVPQLLNASHELFVLDLGCEQENWQEFLRCDLKYLVASLSPWRVNQAERFMENHECEPIKNYITALLTVTGNVYEKKRFQRAYHVPVRTIPFIPDPFLLVKDQLPFFQQLL